MKKRPFPIKGGRETPCPSRWPHATDADTRTGGPRVLPCPRFVGAAIDVADELASWIEEGEIDGFNLTRTVTPVSCEDFVDMVVPEPQDRGF